MQMQQHVNGTTPVLGSLFLNGLVNPTSSDVTVQQATRLSQHEMLATIQNLIMQTERSAEFDHLRLTLGGYELNIIVMPPTTPVSPMSNQPSQATPEQIDIQPQVSHDLIHQGVSQIFQHKHFRNDTLMANNPLHYLTVVKQKCQALMGKRKLAPNALSESHKASILREFLTNCVDELCPLMEKNRPQEFSKSPVEVRQRFTEYLILRWQYIYGQPRKEVKQTLDKYKCWASGGSYGRYLEGARKRLSTLIWQKEMQALQ